ncbi:HPF/RaiA family ribosome-associated protein [Candidatus Woesearchaeota archaeon]|nr:HPF/RaiA family ribosome-associated protein [Candidatus Woesearchaeota archaeon]
MIELGGNIELVGFSELEPASMIVLKKIIGNYARRYTELSSEYEKLSLTLKPVHQIEGSQKYEIHAKVLKAGKPVTSEITDKNLYYAIDSVLKKIEKMLSK